MLPISSLYADFRLWFCSIATLGKMMLSIRYRFSLFGRRFNCCLGFAAFVFMGPCERERQSDQSLQWIRGNFFFCRESLSGVTLSLVDSTLDNPLNRKNMEVIVKGCPAWHASDGNVLVLLRVTYAGNSTCLIMFLYRLFCWARFIQHHGLVDRLLCKLGLVYSHSSHEVLLGLPFSLRVSATMCVSFEPFCS